jgi:hypothetical protein
MFGVFVFCFRLSSEMISVKLMCGVVLAFVCCSSHSERVLRFADSLFTILDDPPTRASTLVKKDETMHSESFSHVRDYLRLMLVIPN